MQFRLPCTLSCDSRPAAVYCHAIAVWTSWSSKDCLWCHHKCNCSGLPYQITLVKVIAIAVVDLIVLRSGPESRMQAKLCPLRQSCWRPLPPDGRATQIQPKLLLEAKLLLCINSTEQAGGIFHLEDDPTSLDLSPVEPSRTATSPARRGVSASYSLS